MPSIHTTSGWPDRPMARRPTTKQVVPPPDPIVIDSFTPDTAEEYVEVEVTVTGSGFSLVTQALWTTTAIPGDGSIYPINTYSVDDDAQITIDMTGGVQQGAWFLALADNSSVWSVSTDALTVSP